MTSLQDWWGARRGWAGHYRPCTSWSALGWRKGEKPPVGLPGDGSNRARCAKLYLRWPCAGGRRRRWPRNCDWNRRRKRRDPNRTSSPALWPVPTCTSICGWPRRPGRPAAAAAAIGRSSPLASPTTACTRPSCANRKTAVLHGKSSPIVRPPRDIIWTGGQKHSTFGTCQVRLAQFAPLKS